MAKRRHSPTILRPSVEVDAVPPGVLAPAGPALPGGGLPPLWFPQAQLETLQFQIEALKTEVGALRQENEALRQENSALTEKIAKLSKNSSNSSKPPSSDITKPKAGNKRKKGDKGKRKIGAQPGHPRHERPLFPEHSIDSLHSHMLTACPDCGGEVVLTDGEIRIIQQVEIVEVPLVRHEHRSYPVWCEKCGQIHYMEFPPEVVREGLFKTRLTALVAYMKNVCHASFSTIRKFIRDVLGETVSRGYLRKVLAKVGDSLEAPYQELLDRLPLETQYPISD